MKPFNYGDTKNPPRVAPNPNETEFPANVQPYHVPIMSMREILEAESPSAEPVVSASPACDEVIRHLESCNKCAESAAAQPIAAPDNRMRCTECKEPVCDHLAAKLIPWLESYVQPVAANPPKMEEIARQIANSIIGPLIHAANGEKKISLNFLDEVAIEVAAILGPFFTQVSQPPTPSLCITFVSPENAPDKWLVWLNGHEIESFDYEHEARALGDKLKAAIFAAPVTTVSANGTEPLHIEGGDKQ